MTEPWRYACPEGHRSISKRKGGPVSRNQTTGYYCDACGTTYTGEPRDMKKENTGRVFKEP